MSKEYNDVKMQVVSGPGVYMADVDQRKSKGEFKGKPEGHLHRTIAETRIDADEYDIVALAAKKFNNATKAAFDALKEVANVVPGGFDNPIVKTALSMWDMSNENLGVGIFIYDKD